MGSHKIRILQVVQEPVTIWAFLTGLIHELENRGYEVEVACNMSSPEIADELREKGIKLNIVDVQRSLNPFKILKAFISFRRLFKRKKFDIVVTHTPIAAFTARFAAYSCRVPLIIYTAHGLPFMKGMNPIKYSLFYCMEKLAGKVTTGLICINEEDYREAVNKKLTKTGYIKRIYGIGIDTEKYKPLNIDRNFKTLKIENEELSIDKNTKLIGFIGRLVKPKGVINYLEMAGDITSKRDDVIFLIAGFGPLEGYIKTFILENKLNDKVKYLGFVKDVREIFNVLDIFVLPTYYPEGMPRTILEAMAMEVPVVTTDSRGCRELVEDGRTGLIVKPQDTVGLTRAVERLIDDNELCRLMGQASREKVIEKYEESLVINEQIEFYEKLLWLR